MIRIALHETTTRDAIDDAALSIGLGLVNIVPKTDAHPAQVIWATPDARATVHLVDEGSAQSFVVRAEGDDNAAIEALWSAKLRQAFEGGS